MNSSKRSRGRPVASVSHGKLTWILICFVSSAVSFYCGIFVGWNMQQNETHQASQESSQCKESSANTRRAVRESAIQRRSKATASATLPFEQVFPQSNVGDLVSGVGLVDREAFATKFDMGVPLDESKTQNDNVIILYSHDHAMPFEKMPNKTGFFSNVEEATQNCENLHVILTHTNRKRQCVALMGQYESFHVQKFMRLPPDDDPNGEKKLDMKYPLRLVNRGAQTSGRKSQKIPTAQQTQEHWEYLVSYIQSLDRVLGNLRPIAEQVASHNHNNAVIVMVCNFGQSELLMNYVCSMHRKGLSDLLKNILVFVTDQETKELADAMGLTTFYEPEVFGGMPKNAARSYGDLSFMKMMAAKVYCVHLISMLGHDLLFQDVDVIWYKNPLPWFHDSTNQFYNFDIYFQDDGNHALFYAPYSANTGFYYVRNNERTRYFFNSLLMGGDLIISTKSHQIALVALLNEHASMYGLKVKIWERNLEEFPGGFSFHRKKDFMKELVQGKRQPYIFHMSWTKNKDNKIKFYEQMGEFYLQDKCMGKPLAEILGGVSVESCCSTDPLIKCHYKDKPSKIPCKNSPPIDKGGRSFW